MRVAVNGSTQTIEANDIAKSYGSVKAVDGVSLSVSEGEFFGILGPNGAGKTTTLEILEGLRQPDRGRATLFGLPVWPRNLKLLPRIGVQLQASAFFERLTAREQIRTFASLYGVKTAKADAMLETVGLADQADIRTEKLSGGQTQRLSLACTLVHDPELVFLDEPTAALDPQARRNLWDLLRGINSSGRTVVLTTHYMDEAETLCDRVAIMDAGKILRVDAPAALMRDLHRAVHVSVAHGTISPEAAAELPGAAQVSDDGVSLTITTTEPAVLLTELVQRQSLTDLQVKGPTLEDVFLELTGREYRA